MITTKTTHARATTAAILTPSGRGAVAVIAIDGPNAAQLVEKFFRPRGEKAFADQPLGRITYGRWGNDLAEDVVACCRAESQIEIHCHGGAVAAQRIVDDLASAGAAAQTWADWIAQHEISPLRGAARTALAHATTHRAASILLDQYHGALDAALRQIVARLDSADVQSVAKEIDQLLARAALGMHLTHPWHIVIAGPPNVGKSSLLNAILGYQRAIVLDQPGTTRDVVTAITAIDGWPMVLSDTAGLRDSGDPLEAAGAIRAAEQAQAADCLLLVFDVSQPWTAADAQLIEKFPRALVVGNKRDLIVSPTTPATVFTSALTGDGIENLLKQICARLVPLELRPGDAVPFTQRQVEQLRLAHNASIFDDISAARSALLSLLANSDQPIASR